tara:strand:- start:6370 stop:7080 length:711 start_codon:yes stop_codon:yes gene_type:complete
MVVDPNLIGISGKIGNGKDLLFDVINYIVTEDYWTSFEHYMHESTPIDVIYENKKFAYPIKWITAVLIGCDIRQLEDREFKNKELGEEWGGLTPRKLLQLLGTEAGRHVIHPNIWVNALFADYKVTNNCSQHSDGLWYTSEHGEAESEVTPVYPNWIVTDVRFPNEAKAIKEKGGILIRINRPQYLDNGLVIRKDEHPSETALDDYDEFDYVIENDGTVQDLIDKVKSLNIVKRIL